ncbi:hypothetical protein EC973_001542 [Apophysomyces ossiformis]|uniref:Uncharacterized protein n=1 Tax=Apophysomyces ossiformis TaxID=679940 RepID=A0A8H7EN40_9FUNG|nr:hypothetical protein EC973_001542 [Apophysomyces ossiformis]
MLNVHLRTSKAIAAAIADAHLNRVKPIEEHNAQSIHETAYFEKLRSEVDRKFCGKDRCRFILPIAITEQESKAQQHFRQIAFLSGYLDRTIVLPNVHSSHLGACRKHPFSFYYDYSWLEDNKDTFSYITMEKFQEWLKERQHIQTIPTGQEVAIDLIENGPLVENCFKERFDFTHRPRSRFQLNDPELAKHRKGNYTELILNALSDEMMERAYTGSAVDIPPVDVINLYYDRRFTFIEHKKAKMPLTYSNQWTDLADQITAKLTPFVAVHWRMERLEPLRNMMPCAQRLVEKVKEISPDDPINVFLLTDYPHLLMTSKAKPESMSFKLNELQQEHHDAVKYVYENLNLTLTTLHQTNDPIPYDELPPGWNLIPVNPNASPADASVLGIVDKLVAIRAQWFLAGEQGKCGKTSSFTRRIIYERLHAYENGSTAIRHPVDVFKLPRK